jgi:hypothetical protein
MPPPGHGRCGLASLRVRLALRPGGKSRPGPAVTDRRLGTNATPRRTVVPVTLKTESPRELPSSRGLAEADPPWHCDSGMQRAWPYHLILTDYDAAYAYHLREVSRARTHDPMREASGGRPPRQPGTTHQPPPGRRQSLRAGEPFRTSKSVPDRNRARSMGSVLRVTCVTIEHLIVQTEVGRLLDGYAGVVRWLDGYASRS